MPAAEERPLRRRALLGALAAAAVGACTPLEFLVANLPAAFGPFRRYQDIAYGTEPQHRLDLYVPERAAHEPCPLVVFWHGGRWESGDKAEYRFVGAALASAGMIAVLPNYRHYPHVKMPGFMQDAARAAAWAAAHAREHHDAAPLLLIGHSSGAHLAALVTLDPRHFAAIGAAPPPIAGVIGLSGPYDFLPLMEADLQDMFGPPPLYPQSQPVNFARADAPPMLLIHGERDDTVAPKNSRNLAAKLAACGADVRLIMYPALGHADTVAALSRPARWRAPVLAEIAAFVARSSAQPGAYSPA